MRPVLSPPCDVVVVNYNTGTLLLDCIRSAIAEGARRVVVVDNGSTDGSLDAVREKFSSQDVVVAANGRNLGFAAACNIGIQASDAQRLLFLNPDSALDRGALSRMMEVLESDDRIGMVGGFLCNPDGSEQAGGRRSFPTPRRAFMRAFGLSGLARVFPGLFSDFLLHTEPLPLTPVQVEAISGACMLVKREAVDDVGLWDEGYFLHCEDLDWSMRFGLKGWKTYFVPDARVVHVRGYASRRRPYFVAWHKHHGMLRFYGKFFRRSYPGSLWWLVVIGVWARFAAVVAFYSVQRLLVMGASRAN